MDLYPSFARLAGAKVPADRVIDGRDVTALMLGREGAASPHEAFFYYSGGGKLEAVRAGKWKLISRGKPVELYDLRADIGESRNLAKAQPDVVVRLTKLMQDHEREIARNSRPVGKEPGPGIVPDL